MISRDVKQQYQTSDLLCIRVETHARYSERQIDLDAECVRALGLTGGEEFARVSGPGGTVLAVTNGPRDLPHITVLRHSMLAHFGLPVPPLPAATFNIENAPDILGAVYPIVEETILTNAFVFTEAAPMSATS